MAYSKDKDVEGKTKEILDEVGINFKEQFGQIPKSIMNFKKDKELMELIDWDNSEIGQVEGDAKARGGGYAGNLRYSIYNPLQAKFILDYYTREGDLVLDPFMGRATRPLVSLYMNRNYIGFDTSSKTIQLNKDLIKKKFPSSDASKHLLIHGDGTKLDVLKNEEDFVDAVFSCPPYYDKEKYSGEDGDISRVKEEEFNVKIQEMFHQLYRLIKTSSYSEMKFYPVIFTVGSVRKNERGIIDMDFLFQQYAKEAGFVLHDKLFTENQTPGAGFTFRRNYCYKFLTKNYETTLVFMKYKKE